MASKSPLSLDLHGQGFYGEINILIFLKRLNGNTELKISPSELYEFYLYLDSMTQSVGHNKQLLQKLFDKIYTESDLLMSQVIGIGNHMSLNLSSDSGVTLFEALCCTLNHLTKKLLILIKDSEKYIHNSDDDDSDSDNSSCSSISNNGSVIIHDLDESKSYITNTALIIWDIIKLLLKYNIKVYHIENNYERISYYPITVLYQSFLILFDNDPYKGDIIDRYIALILKSINLDNSMKLTNNLAVKNTKNTKNSDKKHIDTDLDLDLDYFMPAILTLTGDPGIVLNNFWFGGAFPNKADDDEYKVIIDDNDNKADDDDDDDSEFNISGLNDEDIMESYNKYDGVPSPEMVMNLWFRGFNIISFSFASEDIITEYDYYEMISNQIYSSSDIWSLSHIASYGHNIATYLWIFKMMYSVIQKRFIALMRVYFRSIFNLDDADADNNSILIILSEYHLGLELNTGIYKYWNNFELTYYSMLNIFSIRSDWKSWIATKILPELSSSNLALIKKITSSSNYPEISVAWNKSFISQIYNIKNIHFMQYVFIYAGKFTVPSMRLLLAQNSSNYSYVNYLLSTTNFAHNIDLFWSLWNNSSLFLGLLNNPTVSNDIIELIFYEMNKKYNGISCELILNQCLLFKFSEIQTFSKTDIIWKRLMWILLPTSKYSKILPFKSLNIYKYCIPSICKYLDIIKLKYFINSNLLNPKMLFTNHYVQQLTQKDNNKKVMKFLIVLFDWIVDKCKNEPQIQKSLKEYMIYAKQFRD